MISIGDDLKAIIESYDITAMSFLTFTFSATDILRITEAPRDIVIGSNTFTSADNLAGLSAPQAQNSVDRDNYTVTFNDGDRAMRNRFAGKSGVSLTVQLGFLDDDGVLHSELLDVYKGVSSAVNFKPQGSSWVTEVGFTGQLTQLDSNRVRSTTPQSQHQLDSTDTSMQYVHNGAQDDAIKWGRKD